VGRLTNIKIAAHEMARYRAMALIWQGKVEDGMQEFRRFEGSLPPWLFASQMAGLFECANDIDRCLEFAERAVHLNPNIATTLLDFAWRLLRYERDLPRAIRLMDDAESLVVPELGKPFVLRNRGIIAFFEGRMIEAEHLLLEALEIWERNVDGVFRDSNRMLIEAWLCRVHSRMGKIAEARKELAEVRPWLAATQQDDLLAKCEASL
jgi:hypothetical protein